MTGDTEMFLCSISRDVVTMAKIVKIRTARHVLKRVQTGASDKGEISTTFRIVICWEWGSDETCFRLVQA